MVYKTGCTTWQQTQQPCLSWGWISLCPSLWSIVLILFLFLPKISNIVHLGPKQRDDSEAGYRQKSFCIKLSRRRGRKQQKTTANGKEIEVTVYSMKKNKKKTGAGNDKQTLSNSESLLVIGLGANDSKDRADSCRISTLDSGHNKKLTEHSLKTSLITWHRTSSSCDSYCAHFNKAAQILQLDHTDTVI